MQKRGFLILAGTTLVVLVLAIITVVRGDREVSHAIPGQKALPGLAPRLGDLAWVRLSRGKTRADFAQIGKRWVVVEKGNYPAAAGKVRQTLLALADLTLIEPKTRRPELFGRLDVDNPDNGKATLVTVQDKAGHTVAELIVGKRRYDRLGGGNDGVYVRRPGENQAWLARGTLDVSGGLISWLDRRVLDIPDARIASVSLKGADGATLVITRTAPDADFAVQDPPADAKFKSAAVIGEPAAALEAVDLDDVKPAADMPVPDNGVVTASFKTFKGLVVNLRLFERDKTNWVAIDAAGSGTVEAESKQINDKVARWIYAIPLFKANMLRTKIADLIEPPAKGS
jgi:Domain of unknown function (DUF4340)